MIKKAQYSYKGMNQDLSKSKRGPEFYFEAKNIRITPTEDSSLGSVTIEKGNSLVGYLDAEDMSIIAAVDIDNYLVLFSTNNNGNDAIYRIDIEDDYCATKLIEGDLGFSTSNYIEAVGNYENDSLIKVYWVDGINQYRFIDIINPVTDIGLLDVVPEFTISQPKVISTERGGTHTAGQICYAYNLSKKYGQQTGVSPISPLTKLTTQNGGGEVNEIVSQTNNIQIENIDTRFDIIKLYSIKYTSYNTLPVVSLIAEEEINNIETFTYSDDGSIIYNISLEELLFLGGTPTIPGTITNSKNEVLLGDITETYFNINTDLDQSDDNYFDPRAYRFKLGNSTSTVIKNSGEADETVSYDGVSQQYLINGSPVSKTHDCINEDFDNYNLLAGTTDRIGATGNDLYIEIISVDPDNKEYVLKDNEIYRFGIEFYNTRGQVSPAHWICDLKIPQRNLYSNSANGLRVVLRNPSKLIAQGVVGWRVLRVERTDANKTVLDQGILSTSVFQILTENEVKDCQSSSIYKPVINIGSKLNSSQLNTVNSLTKIPSPLFRGYNDVTDFKIDNKGRSGSSADPTRYREIKVNKLLHNHLLNYNDLEPVDEGEYKGRSVQPYGEMFSTRKPRGKTGEGNKSITVQNNKLLQFYSPEAVLLQKEVKGVDNYRPIAKLGHSIDYSNVWGKKYKISTQLVETELTKEKGISLYDIDSNYGDSLLNDTNIFKSFKPDLFFNQNGLIGPIGDNVSYTEYQYGREFYFKSSFSSAEQTKRSFLNDEDPLFVGKGERNKSFAGSDDYRFNNDLQSIISEKNLLDQSALFDAEDEDDYCQVLASVNSIGNNCYLFVDSTENSLETILREDLHFSDSAITDAAVLVEFTRNLSNQYGGNTYEARSRNTYLRIGDYTPISMAVQNIERAGDVFVDTFRFARILPNTSKVFSSKYSSICEILEFPVESSIDLKERSDASAGGWNSTFHPSYDDYHSYNRVYSQEPIFNTNSPELFTFEAVKKFSTKVLATKSKTSGELVDSWTDILLNEELVLNGSYGRIIKLINSNGRMLAFQETAIATVQVKPRIQQVTTDGTGIELGTGQVLYNYEYNISTTSGSTNKRTIFKSPSAIYYVDSINKSINRISQGLEGLTDVHGLHTWATKNIINSYRNSIDVHGAFDYINNDAYFIFEDDFAIRFNELTNSFTDFINLEECNIIFKSKFGLHSSNNSNRIYKHFEGNRATYYGTTYDSYITLLANPNPYSEVVFNNINFKSELYDVSGEDVFTSDGISHVVPIESIKIWNEYQESSITPLVYNVNITRAFRDWSMLLPRDATNPLDRIRGQWCYIKLNINNDNNYNLILHDVILSYYDNTNIR